MNLKTEMMLAGRYLKPRRNAISVITCISILGVTLGVAVLVVVLSVMTGLTDLIKDKLLKTSPHLQIKLTENRIIGDPDKVTAAIEKIGGHGAAVVMRPVVIQTAYRLLPRMAFGIDYADIVGHLELNVQGVDGQVRLGPRQAFLSRSGSQELLATTHSKIVIHSPEQLGQMVETASDGVVKIAANKEFYVPKELEVSGLFSSGNNDFDQGTILINREDANDLFDMPLGSVDTVYGWVKDPFQMDSELANLRDALPEYQIEPWMFTHRKVLGVLQVERNMMFFLLIFIVLVAAFSITNTLITVIHQKTREIGVLNSLGASRRSIMRIFIMQGMFVGIFGALGGIAGGIAAVFWRLALMNWFGRLTGQELFPKEYYIVHELPARLVATDLVFIGLIAIILCTLGAALPAYVASRLDPAKALRHG